MKPQARILVVEDEPLVRELVALNLRHSGHEIETAETYAEGLERLQNGDYALAIFDVMLPGGDGFALTRAARRAGKRWPILLLTARGDTASKVKGLDSGADDYLTKPFDVPELLARVRALIRRGQARFEPAGEERFTLGARWARLDTGEAETNEGPVTLTDKELKLLQLFAARENQPLSRADILEEVWGMDSFPTDRTVDNFVMRLRRLFEPTPEEPRHFITLRGRGYIFRSAV